MLRGSIIKKKMRRHVRILVAAVGFVRVWLHAERVDGNDGKKLRREQESEREGGREGGRRAPHSV